MKDFFTKYPDWKLNPDIPAIEKTYSFPDFQSALNFVNTVGTIAEAADHHPDIQLSWGKVTIQLSTHSKSKVTEKDFNLAEKIEQAFEKKASYANK